MKKNNNFWTSVVEAVIVTLIVTTWLLWMYKVFHNSMNFSNSIENRIVAIQIAREWIEAMTNIRDTNWLLFSADYENCWNVLNYNINCVWNSSNALEIGIGHYIIYPDADNRRTLERPTSSVYDFTHNELLELIYLQYLLER